MLFSIVMFKTSSLCLRWLGMRVGVSGAVTMKVLFVIRWYSVQPKGFVLLLSHQEDGRRSFIYCGESGKRII